MKCLECEFGDENLKEGDTCPSCGEEVSAIPKIYVQLPCSAYGAPFIDPDFDWSKHAILPPVPPLVEEEMRKIIKKFQDEK